jgi:aspartyl protease family protein
MALSHAASSAMRLATLWVALAGVGAVAALNFDIIRDVVGIRFEPEDFTQRGAPASDAPDKPSEATEEEQESETPRVQAHRVVQLKAGSNGHFFSRIHVNGRAVDAMVDTGASVVALTFEDAASAGVHVRDPDFSHRVTTANGVARVAIVTLDSVAIEDITVRHVRAAVAEPGKLTKTLLGMSFLGQLRRTEMSRGVLVLEE